MEASDLEGCDDADPLHNSFPLDQPRLAPFSAPKQLSSRYRGVCWSKKNKRWQAAINSGGKYRYLGLFKSEEAAARAFDRAAIKLRGNKAKLNFELTDYVDVSGRGRDGDDDHFSASGGLDGTGGLAASSLTAANQNFYLLHTNPSRPPTGSIARQLQGLALQPDLQNAPSMLSRLTAAPTTTAATYSTVLVQGEVLSLPAAVAAAVNSRAAQVDGMIPSGRPDVYVVAYRHCDAPNKLSCVLVDTRGSPQELGSYNDMADAQQACGAAMTIYLKLQDQLETLSLQLSKAQSVAAPAPEAVQRFRYIPLDSQRDFAGASSTHVSVPASSTIRSAMSTGFWGASFKPSKPADVQTSSFQSAHNIAAAVASACDLRCDGPSTSDLRYDVSASHHSSASDLRYDVSASHRATLGTLASLARVTNSHSWPTRDMDMGASRPSGEAPQLTVHRVSDVKVSVVTPESQLGMHRQEITTGGHPSDGFHTSQPGQSSADAYYVNQPEATDELLAALGCKRRRDDEETGQGPLMKRMHSDMRSNQSADLQVIANLADVGVSDIQKLLSDYSGVQRQ